MIITKINLLSSGFYGLRGPQCLKQKKSKRNKFFDLARELRKLGNVRVTVIQIVVSVPETIPKDLERGQKELEIRVRIETI